MGLRFFKARISPSHHSVYFGVRRLRILYTLLLADIRRRTMLYPQGSAGIPQLITTDYRKSP